MDEVIVVSTEEFVDEFRYIIYDLTGIEIFSSDYAEIYLDTVDEAKTLCRELNGVYFVIEKYTPFNSLQRVFASSTVSK